MLCLSPEIWHSVVLFLSPKSCARLGETNKAMRALVDGHSHYWGRVAIHGMFRQMFTYQMMEDGSFYPNSDKRNLFYIRHVYHSDRDAFMERYVKSSIQKIDAYKRRQNIEGCDAFDRALMPSASLEDILRAGEALRIMFHGRDEVLKFHFTSGEWTFKNIARVEYSIPFDHYVDLTPQRMRTIVLERQAVMSFFDVFDELKGDFKVKDLILNIIKEELAKDLFLRSELMSVRCDKVLLEYFPDHSLEEILSEGSIVIRRDAIYNRLRLRLREGGLPHVGRVMQQFRKLFSSMQAIYFDYSPSDIVTFTMDIFKEMCYGDFTKV